MELQGRVALITGASSGIGEATASRLAVRGMRVGILARRADRLEALASRIRAAGGAALVLPADVTDQGEVEAALATLVAEFGGLDLLVNSAGVAAFGPVEKLEPAELRRVLDVNTFGTLNAVRAALPHLKAGRGTIVNVSSFLGDRALPYLGALAASKAAVDALTEALRMEVSPNGVHVLLFGPPETRTEFHGQTAGGPARRSGRALSDPAEVAAALVRAVEKGRRAVVRGRFFKVADLLAPTLLDRLFEKTMVARLHERLTG